MLWVQTVSLLLSRFHLLCVAETENKRVSSRRNGDLVSCGVFPFCERENLGYSVLFYSHLLFYVLYTLIITILKMHFKVEKKNYPDLGTNFILPFPLESLSKGTRNWTPQIYLLVLYFAIFSTSCQQPFSVMVCSLEVQFL